MRLWSRVPRVAALAFAWLFAGVTRPSFAQPGAPAKPHPYAIAAWSTEQGLPSNIVLDVRQTPDGYLWIASYQGLSRFDGVSFRTFAEADIPGVERASFWKLVTDTAGALWVTSESSGLVRLKDGRWSVFKARDGLTTDNLTVLTTGRGDVVWVGSRQGVSRVANGRIEALRPPPDGEQPYVVALSEDHDGTLWIATSAKGVLRYRDGHYTSLTTRDGLADNRATFVYTLRDGSVLVGTYGVGVTCVRNGVVTRVAMTGRDAPQSINAFFEDKRGTIWVGADNGLFRLDGDRAVPVTLADGQPIPQVAVIRNDAEGNLWVGSRQAGLFRLRDAAVRMLTADSTGGLPHNLVYAVTGDGADGQWIATHGGVMHHTPRGNNIYTKASGALPNDIVRDVLRDRAGNVWFATTGGLTRFHDGSLRTYSVRDGLPDDRVRTLLEDRAGRLWIGTFRGLAELTADSLRTWGHQQGLNDAYILSAFEDRRGTIWVGTQSQGVFRLAGSRFIPGPPQLRQQPIFRISEDADGTLWFGTTRGLARLHDETLTWFTVRDGLPGNTIFQTLDDGVGYLWVTGPWGLGRIWRPSLERVRLGTDRSLTAKQLGRDDELAAREASSISKAWRAADGALWFATPSGVAIVDPGRLRRNERPPPAHIEQVVVDDEPMAADHALEVPPGARKLEFHFTAPSFVSTAQLRFRYRLDGFDREWVDGGTRRVAFYTNLPPGHFTFRVEARNEDGVWSSAPATIAVHLRPFFWQTMWFVTLVLAVVGAGVVAGHRLRLNAVQRRLREEMLRALSLRDELTGLYNRRGLLALAEQEIRAAERSRRGFAIVFVDMDGMKLINDSLGHPEGDRALTDTAALLRTAFRESDVIARLGGDEFAVLVADASDSLVVMPGSGAEAATIRLHDAIARHNATAGRQYHLSMSLGTSRFDPAEPITIDALIEAADQAMYAQKRDKRSQRVRQPA